jgi:hypothetical protein
VAYFMPFCPSLLRSRQLFTNQDSVTFAAGGTLVNALMIYVLLPLLNKVTRDNKKRNLQL